MEKQVTIKQAYKAMFLFVKEYYYRKNEPEDIGNLLGDVQLMSYLYDDPNREEDEDGNLNTVDPASWYDWLEAVEKILKEEALNE